MTLPAPTPNFASIYNYFGSTNLLSPSQPLLHQIKPSHPPVRETSLFIAVPCIQRDSCRILGKCVQPHGTDLLSAQFFLYMPQRAPCHAPALKFGIHTEPVDDAVCFLRILPVPILVLGIAGLVHGESDGYLPLYRPHR